jgi:very-short-patch-repair endonuclease
MRITRNQPVTQKKRELARQMRRNMTPEERILWQALRNDALQALHFRRQQVIAGYIVDFYCATAQLAVEVDGGSHMGRQEEDGRRDRVLAEMGIRTIRVTNDSVVNDLTYVLRRIADEAKRGHPK